MGKSKKRKLRGGSTSPPKEEVIIYDNGDEYEGQIKLFEDGKKEKQGKGKMTYKNNDVYVGHWKDGKRHGRGVFTFASGSQYDGEWGDDKKNGRGVYTYADRSVYDGEWKDDKKNGQGVFIFFNDDQYEGVMKDDKKNGLGVYRFADGSQYDGEWKDGNYNGRGVYKYADGSRYEGDWKNDKKSGKGKITYANQDVYDGNWEDNKYHGKGVMTYNNGNDYDGNWNNNKRHGEGVMTYHPVKGGKTVVHKGMWNDDHLLIDEKFITSFKADNCSFNKHNLYGFYECLYTLEPITDGIFAQLSDGACYSFEALRNIKTVERNGKIVYKSGLTRNLLESTDIDIINYLKNKKDYDDFYNKFVKQKKIEINTINFNALHKPETLIRTKSSKSKGSKKSIKRRMTL